MASAFTHAAAALALGTAFADRETPARFWVLGAVCERMRGERLRLWTYFFLAVASHGVLDAMTNGGLGVAFFAPFDDRRFFFPFHPILVSPVRPSRFFDARGLAVLQSELLWVWLPAAAFATGTWLLRRAAARMKAFRPS
jgi:inner membrane protein